MSSHATEPLRNALATSVTQHPAIVHLFTAQYCLVDQSGDVSWLDSTGPRNTVMFRREPRLPVTGPTRVVQFGPECLFLPCVATPFSANHISPHEFHQQFSC